jgi:uroporphyrinogen decarboxylase
VDDDLADVLGVDARGVAPPAPPPLITETVEDLRYRDEYGIGWRMPRDGGLYFDMYEHPLRGDIGEDDLRRFSWPGVPAREELAPMVEEARGIAEGQGRAVVVGSVSWGMMETIAGLRGYEDFYSDVALDPALVGSILDRVLERKAAYWERVLDLLGDTVDVVKEADDFAGQRGLLISPDAYRRLFKPRQRELFDLIHSRSSARIFFHSCGAVRAIIPDLIEVGVDALNPVQVSAAGMDSRELKAEFGRELVFWGGGVDTQRVLGSGSEADVRDEVRRRLDDLMPGGGFVFSAVHNIQADVPPANIVAMLEALREYGVYAPQAG